MTEVTVRRATHDDHEAVSEFTRDTWAERETGDYIPHVFGDWVDDDGPAQRTVVAAVGGEDESEDTIVGICQGRLLSDHEAWLQGMRVAPDYRGGGYGLAMVDDLFHWARERGATVARNMVFGWNGAGLGQSVAAGFEPRTSFRWARPKPSAAAEPDRRIVDDPAAAWSYWARSEAWAVLGGLALATDDAWALSELTRERLLAMADDEWTFAVTDDGTRGMAARVRTTDQPTDEGVEALAEYAVGAWADRDAAAALFDAIRRDAHDLGVDATRVLVPESPRHVAEAAASRANVAEHCDFVLEADLTGVE